MTCLAERNKGRSAPSGLLHTHPAAQSHGSREERPGSPSPCATRRVGIRTERLRSTEHLSLPVFFFYLLFCTRTSQSLFRKLSAYPLGEVSQTPSSAHLKQSASERLETHPAPQIHGLTVTWKVNPLPLFSKTQFHPA